MNTRPVSTVHPSGAVEVHDVTAYGADHPGTRAYDVATCGTCGRSWDDSVSSAVTPTPGGRCPFEYDHEEDPGPACSHCGNAVGPRIDSTGQRGQDALWAEVGAWDDDRDFQCGVSGGEHAVTFLADGIPWAGSPVALGRYRLA